MIFNFFRRNRHAGWYQDLDAYVDGELSHDQVRRFEAHVAACDRCARAMEDARFAKLALSALPALEAPRSFALTEAMIASKPIPVVRPAGTVYRLAQATAFAAVAGFAMLVVLDVAGGVNGRDDAAASAGDLSSTAAESAPAGGDGGVAQLAPAAAGAETPDGTPPGGVAATGAQGGSDTSDAGQDGSGEQRTAGASGKVAPDDAGSMPPALALDASEDDRDVPGALRLVELGLAGLAIVAAGSWVLMRRRQRSMQ